MEKIISKPGSRGIIGVVMFFVVALACTLRILFGNSQSDDSMAYLGAFAFTIAFLIMLFSLKIYILEKEVFIVKKWVSGSETKHEMKNLISFIATPKNTTPTTATNLGLLPKDGYLELKFNDDSRVLINHTFNDPNFDTLGHAILDYYKKNIEMDETNATK